MDNYLVLVSLLSDSVLEISENGVISDDTLLTFKQTSDAYCSSAGVNIEYPSSNLINVLKDYIEMIYKTKSREESLEILTMNLNKIRDIVDSNINVEFYSKYIITKVYDRLLTFEERVSLLEGCVVDMANISADVSSIMFKCDYASTLVNLYLQSLSKYMSKLKIVNNQLKSFIEEKKNYVDLL